MGRWEGSHGLEMREEGNSGGGGENSIEAILCEIIYVLFPIF